MEIRPFLYTDADYEAAVAVWNAAWPESHLAVAEWKHMNANRDPAFLNEIILVEENNQVIALGQFFEPPWAHMPGKVELAICVHPDWQGQGVGTAVYDHIVCALVLRQPTMLTAKTHENKKASLRFLAQHGFRQVMRESVSQLDVAQFQTAPYQPLLLELVKAGIQITPLPDLQPIYKDWARRLWDLEWELVQDIPTADTHTRQPLETYQEEILGGPWFDPNAWTVAVADGRFIGVSMFWISSTNRKLLHAGLTGVLRAYRRRGVATALKVRGIQFAQTYEAEHIRTINEENNPMYVLNQILGFVPLPALLHFEKHLKPGG